MDLDLEFSRGVGRIFEKMAFLGADLDLGFFRGRGGGGCFREKVFLGTFWKILTKKLRFFGARSPSKLIYFGAKGAFRKTLGSVSQKIDVSK